MDRGKQLRIAAEALEYMLELDTDIIEAAIEVLQKEIKQSKHNKRALQ